MNQAGLKLDYPSTQSTTLRTYEISILIALVSIRMFFTVFCRFNEKGCLGVAIKLYFNWFSVNTTK